MPYLDLANHQPRAPPTHGVSPPAAERGGASDNSETGGAGEAGFFELRSCAGYLAGQEVFIDYGEKDNRWAAAARARFSRWHSAWRPAAVVGRGLE